MTERVRFRDRVSAFMRALTEPPKAPEPHLYSIATITRTVTINGQVVEGPEADEIDAIMERHHAAVFKDFGSLNDMFDEIEEVVKRKKSSDG